MILDRVGIFADGVAVRAVGELTFPIAQPTVDEIVRVSNDEICAAIKDVFDDTRSFAHPPVGSTTRMPGTTNARSCVQISTRSPDSPGELEQQLPTF